MRLATVVLLLIPALAQASWEPLFLCSARSRADGAVSLVCTPDGRGSPLSEAKVQAGNEVDATIDIEMIDQNAVPMAAYPAEDLWLMSEDPGLVLFDGGLIADGPTDALGRTTMSGAVRAGGLMPPGTTTGLKVMTGSGLPIPTPIRNIAVNSVDLNGDGVVNLSDVVFFGQAYLDGSYDYSVDLFHDGQINLMDLIVFAELLPTAAP
ncbi:MAG TPA: hypothetical protein P5571_08880 [Candidatus Krumholzibacteria bacterium]|nr:hypothetical protein [Candidatus Krumholzibacteria bacterium]HRX51462.1 hypothetical protein [Candidatus Krumholzibacteria bacterium]